MKKSKYLWMNMFLMNKALKEKKAFRRTKAVGEKRSIIRLQSHRQDIAGICR